MMVGFNKRFVFSFTVRHKCVQYENNATPVVLLAVVLRVFRQGVRASRHVTLFPLRDTFKEKDILFQMFFAIKPD